MIRFILLLTSFSVISFVNQVFAQDLVFDFTQNDLAYWQGKFGSIWTHNYTLPNSGGLNSDGLILKNRTGYSTNLHLVSSFDLFYGWSGDIITTDGPYSTPWCGGMKVMVKRRSDNSIVVQDSYYTNGSGYKNLDLIGLNCTDPDGWYLQIELHQGYGTSDGNLNRLKKVTITNYNYELDPVFFSGPVGIGTLTPTQDLSVAGTINADEIIVENVSGSDFVFDEDYNLRSLESTEAFIKTHKHLPEIASAAEMAEEGVKLKEFNMQLLQKIEELTLYLIEERKKNLGMQREVAELKRVQKAILQELRNN